jgi:hypothetical protein
MWFADTRAVCATGSVLGRAAAGCAPVPEGVDGAGLETGTEALLVDALVDALPGDALPVEPTCVSAPNTNTGALNSTDQVRASMIPEAVMPWLR